ncbi:PREDICTED: MAM domain-containing glycosylphosphatidylinositol anchor protein 1-like [Myotis brandtii]|uniref:MAM domain-containing glycosylphosphatidylinositol anchor protein 1-like n=1 Tax=Myotis brandtii TaxID=109478 RepID=UPI000703E3B8|nr:PREDICTED: MAM domain-containing glycosylphosphatidylinositol anchor protein 1-like [Myotis brandtii]
MKNATFQITPDVIKESENIQLGQDLKLSCHVDAVPQEKVTYQWFKNGKLARMSKRLLVTRNDPELPAVTSSLELIDLHFSDYGTYLCVASFPGAPVPDLSVEVNISSETGGQLEGQRGGVKELERPTEGRGAGGGGGAAAWEREARVERLLLFMPHTFIKHLFYARHRGRCWGRVVGKIGSALIELSRKANIFQIASQMNVPLANCDA